MTTHDERRIVLELATEYAHDNTVTRKEWRALRAEATRLDIEHNRQTVTNPRLADQLSDCTYQPDHDKTCICRGDALAYLPKGGWSRLTAQLPEEPSS